MNILTASGSSMFSQESMRNYKKSLMEARLQPPFNMGAVVWCFTDGSYSRMKDYVIDSL